MTVLGDEVHSKIVSALAIHHDIKSKDGWIGPNCQTGEFYIEVTVRAANLSVLATALTGAIAAFGGRGFTCYWRVKTDIDDSMDTPRAYVRFCVSNAPEMSQEKAA
jgi:hypothetical protein